MNDDYDNRPVTNRQLRDELVKRPTTAEVRVLILLAVLANQLIPALDFSTSSVRSGAGALVRALPL